ncbi:MAG: DEAD/DEAH box helicase family protein [Gemmatimonadota bacterium]|nr:DEAD/DEAH box helicase family protein [Gemmatimonadota bacterium]
MAKPYDQILLRRKRARRQPTSLPVVTCAEAGDVETWPNQLTLAWDSLGNLESYGDTPEKVLQSWTNKFDFRTENEAVGMLGLRTPQIGALHAISAHFAVGKEFEAATVVLPTGTGKTETMLATQVYRRLKRTLVIVPSNALRSQIGDKFISLGVLPDVGVVPRDLPRPHVAIIEGGIKTVADARSIVEYSNVIVALPNVLQASNCDAASYLIEACTDLIVDEAHHVTAATWNAIRELFKEKRIIQFTATPFRRDGKRIDGKIIFNYKLGDAQAADYYRRINLRTIEEYGDQSMRDQAIAEEAIIALRRDIDELDLDHLLMARTRTKKRAEEVAAIYRTLAPELNPVVVFSGPGRIKANKEALARILDKSPIRSRVVVCVDMLGEGFDLPSLKVAALHDIHKSLAVTLQFIGRFTRTGDWGQIGEATVVTNIADPDAESRLAKLYAEGADWDQIIRQLSEERIGSELRLQDVVFGLKETGNLHSHLSLWNLRPTLSARFFRTTCSNWSPLEFRSVLPTGAESWFAFNETENVLVAVVCRSAEVNWGNYYQTVLDTIYDLLVLRWDKEESVLCLYASNYDALRSDQIAQVVTDETAELVSGTPIFNILNNVELPLVKSLGSSRIGVISFTSYFGPNVTDGLASIEKAESSLNNIACLGYEDGERVLWGGTQRRGKIWQQKSGTIAEWISWTSATWAKVTSEDKFAGNITRDFLRPKRMPGPHGSIPISVQWGEQAQTRLRDRQFVIFGETEIPLFMVDLEIGDINNDRSIFIKLVSETVSSKYRLSISRDLQGGYEHKHISGPTVRFRVGTNQALSLEDYLQKDPLIIRYADGTYSYNCYHIPASLDAGIFEKGKLEAWDWNGIPLNKEAMRKERDTATIQYRTFERLRNDYDVIFNDDGCGEAADLICLKDEKDENVKDENAIRLCLVHCKGAHEGRISQDIRNFYTVCGQAQKSINVKHAGVRSLYNDLKRRHEAWVSDGASRFLKGDMKQLAYFKEKARRTKLEFEMILVQPGASLESITDDSLRLLATTELYLIKTTQASLRVVISP